MSFPPMHWPRWHNFTIFSYLLMSRVWSCNDLVFIYHLLSAQYTSFSYINPEYPAHTNLLEYIRQNIQLRQIKCQKNVGMPTNLSTGNITLSEKHKNYYRSDINIVLELFKLLAPWNHTTKFCIEMSGVIQGGFWFSYSVLIGKCCSVRERSTLLYCQHSFDNISLQVLW